MFWYWVRSSRFYIVATTEQIDRALFTGPGKPSGIHRAHQRVAGRYLDRVRDSRSEALSSVRSRTWIYMLERENRENSSTSISSARNL